MQFAWKFQKRKKFISFSSTFTCTYIILKKILPSYSTSDALIALHQTEDYMATLTRLLIIHFNTVSTDTSFWCIISLCSTTAITSHQCTDDLKQNKESIVHVTPYFGMFQVSCCWVLWRYFWWCDHPQMLLLGTMKIFVVMPLYSTTAHC